MIMVEELVEEYYPTAIKMSSMVARKLNIDAEEAASIASEVLFYASETWLRKNKDKSGFAGYLYVSIKNNCIEYVKKENQKVYLEDLNSKNLSSKRGWEDFISFAKDKEEDIYLKEVLIRAMQGCSALDSSTKEEVVEKILESPESIYSILLTYLNTVQAHRVVSRLKVELLREG